MISRLAGLQVPDVASGFRAFSRECAIQLSTFTNFDHTAEHVIEAGYKNLAVTSVAVRTNPKTRESRLFSNIGKFVFKSGEISLRTYARYVALKIFALCGILTFAAGFCLGVRFLYFFFFTDEGMLHVQSADFGGDSAVGRVQMFLTGVIADLIATNRDLLGRCVAANQEVGIAERKVISQMKKPAIYIDGQEGTTGLRIRQMLAGRRMWRCCSFHRSSAETGVCGPSFSTERTCACSACPTTRPPRPSPC